MFSFNSWINSGFVLSWSRTITVLAGSSVLRHWNKLFSLGLTVISSNICSLLVTNSYMWPWYSMYTLLYQVSMDWIEWVFMLSWRFSQHTHTHTLLNSKQQLLPHFLYNRIYCLIFLFWASGTKITSKHISTHCGEFILSQPHFKFLLPSSSFMLSPSTDISRSFPE